MICERIKKNSQAINKNKNTNPTSYNRRRKINCNRELFYEAAGKTDNGPNMVLQTRCYAKSKSLSKHIWDFKGNFHKSFILNGK